jgi:hypothetical protein
MVRGSAAGRLIAACESASVACKAEEGNLVAYAELAVDLAEVMPDRIRRAAQPSGDLLVGQTFAVLRNDLGLTWLSGWETALAA